MKPSDLCGRYSTRWEVGGCTWGLLLEEDRHQPVEEPVWLLGLDPEPPPHLPDRAPEYASSLTRWERTVPQFCYSGKFSVAGGIVTLACAALERDSWSDVCDSWPCAEIIVAMIEGMEALRLSLPDGERGLSRER